MISQSYVMNLLVWSGIFISVGVKKGVCRNGLKFWIGNLKNLLWLNRQLECMGLSHFDF